MMSTKLVASKLSCLLEESESYTTLLAASLASLLESTECVLENLPPNAAVVSTLATLQSSYRDTLRLKHDWEKKTRSLTDLRDRAASQLVDSMFPFATHYMDSVSHHSTRSTSAEQGTSEWQEWKQLLDEYQIQLPLSDARALDGRADPQARQAQPQQSSGSTEDETTAATTTTTTTGPAARGHTSTKSTRAALHHEHENGHGDEDDDDEGEGLVMTKEKTSLICPITQQPYVAPMMNPACKHSYSHAAILQLCARGRGSVSCPVAGCDKRVDARALMPNHALERAIRRDQRRRANQAQNHHERGHAEGHD